MKKYTFILILFCAIVGCSDIIEEDLTNDIVQVLSPQDNFSANSTTINFFWDHLEGADEYQIEIVKGRFDSIASFIVDTFLSENQFVYNFNPGQYQWSIRAVNSEYSTSYFTRSFRVDSLSDIAQSTVLLTFPVLNEFYGDSSLTLSWQSIFNATSYVVRMIDKSTNNFVLLDTVATNFLSTGDILGSKNYQWEVKALNSESETAFSSSSFTVDLTNPEIPALIKPDDQLSPAIGPVVNFTWRSGQDENWAYDRIYVYRTTLSSAPIIDVIITDSTYIDSTSFISTGVYKWRVKSFDKVDNSSDFSGEGEFTYQ
jgi:hypothetical protein